MKQEAQIWVSELGERVTCIEKIKVMKENLEEIKQIAQDIYEDGILMGISPSQLKNCLVNIMHNLHNPYTN